MHFMLVQMKHEIAVLLGTPVALLPRVYALPVALWLAAALEDAPPVDAGTEALTEHLYQRLTPAVADLLLAGHPDFALVG